MTADEFHKTARIMDDTCGTTVDVRPFGDRQSDAVYSCLYQMCVAIKEGTLSTNAKSIFVLHDTGTDITSETFDLLKNLWSLDVGVNLKEADS
jgi:hypothetical protein